MAIQRLSLLSFDWFAVMVICKIDARISYLGGTAQGLPLPAEIQMTPFSLH